MYADITFRNRLAYGYNTKDISLSVKYVTGMMHEWMVASIKYARIIMLYIWFNGCDVYG